MNDIGVGTRPADEPRQDRAPFVTSRPPTSVNKLLRLTWNIVQATVYRWSPTQLHGWRRFLLRLFGADIAKGAHPYPDAKIWAPWNLIMERGSCLGPRSICYSAALVHLGQDAIVSQGVHLCAASHDYRDEAFALLTAPIVIKAGAWVASDAFIGPGVTVDERAVVGARAVAMKNVPAASVVAGNPAKFVKMRSE